MSGDLLRQAEALRVEACADLDPASRARLGQFFTPHQAAELIAAMPRLPDSEGTIRVLDPGAGTGMLMAALVERLATERSACSIHVTAIEIDDQIFPALVATTERCRQFAAASGMSLTVDLRCEDLVAAATGLLSAELWDVFDLIVMNPPYAKLAAGASHRRALLAHGVDCPNLYAAFLAVGVLALKPGGQLVAITPRSFANGPYFERFRRFLLRSLTLERIHTFESRSTVFSDTGVLQENIVFAGTRERAPGSVRFTVSHDHTDQPAEYIVDYGQVVRPDDPHKFVRITTGDADSAVAGAMAAMPATLVDLGLAVSTGKVVDFRARDNLRIEAGPDCVPLIYPGNLRNGGVRWPRAIRKPQGFALLAEADRRLLVPAGCYVVVKRFSAKEERRRVVAAVWDARLNGDVPVAFENHLNVIHRVGTGLDSTIAVGLSAWLNSSIVDQYFRTFSGHTQVNANDLRSMRYPSLGMLQMLGESVPLPLPDQDELDRLVEKAMSLEGAQ
jgi:adenine-specific DNA-methyltransferase